MTELKRVTELVIDRTKWARGDNADCYNRSIGDYYDRALLDCEGGMCCLGFLAEATGCSVEDMKGEDHPSDEMTVLYGLAKPEDVYSENRMDTTPLWSPFILINDNSEMEVTDRSREEKIKKLFKERLGVSVTFTGTTPRDRDRGEDD